MATVLTKNYQFLPVCIIAVLSSTIECSLHSARLHRNISPFSGVYFSFLYYTNQRDLLNYEILTVFFYKNNTKITDPNLYLFQLLYTETDPDPFVQI